MLQAPAAEDGRMLPRIRVETEQWEPIDKAVRLRVGFAQDAAPFAPIIDVLSRLLSEDYSPVKSAQKSGALGAAYAAGRDLNRMLDAANRVARRSQQLSALCMALDDKIASHGLPTRQDYGLTADRRWPQPAPVLFFIGPRFAFRDAAPGPLTCWATKDYDIDRSD
jgi:hypothetical protein